MDGDETQTAALRLGYGGFIYEDGSDLSVVVGE